MFPTDKDVDAYTVWVWASMLLGMAFGDATVANIGLAPILFVPRQMPQQQTIFNNFIY